MIYSEATESSLIKKLASAAELKTIELGAPEPHNPKSSKLNKIIDPNFKKIDFLPEVRFAGCDFNSQTNFEDIDFKEPVAISANKFSEETNFWKFNFLKYASFRYNHFLKPVTFTWVNFPQDAHFDGTYFSDSAVFKYDVKFEGETTFDNSYFWKKAVFSNTRFQSSVSFLETWFEDIYFDRSIFVERPNFSRTTFHGVVSFEHTKFQKGLDLRKANLDHAKVILLEGIDFPIGQFYVRWEQLNANGKPRIHVRTRLHPFGINGYENRDLGFGGEDEYRRIEIIYKELYSIFLAQKDNSAADGVMYELEWQKSNILGGVWQKLYGLIMGYGYQPWRFFLVILPIVLAFAVIWDKYYHVRVAEILNQKIEKKEINIADISPLARVWYALHFSVSVLLGIRFQKEGIHVQDRRFLLIVTIEWIFGISLYILFFALVKTAEFTYIKELLGF